MLTTQVGAVVFIAACRVENSVNTNLKSFLRSNSELGLLLQ